MALMAPWPTPLLQPLVLEEMLILMKMSFSPSAQIKVSVIIWMVGDGQEAAAG